MKMRWKIEEVWCGEGEVGWWFLLLKKIKGNKKKSAHNKLKTDKLLAHHRHVVAGSLN